MQHRAVTFQDHHSNLNTKYSKLLSSRQNGGSRSHIRTRLAAAHRRHRGNQRHRHHAFVHGKRFGRNRESHPPRPSQEVHFAACPSETKKNRHYTYAHCSRCKDQRHRGRQEPASTCRIVLILAQSQQSSMTRGWGKHQCRPTNVDRPCRFNKRPRPASTPLRRALLCYLHVGYSR